MVTTQPKPVTPWQTATRWWPLAAALALVVLIALELPIWRRFDGR